MQTNDHEGDDAFLDWGSSFRPTSFASSPHTHTKSNHITQNFT